MSNPFEIIDARLNNLEALTLETLQFLRNRPVTEPATYEIPVTPDEAAALFKISKVSLWSWEKKGIIKGHHLGNKKYFLRSELIAALTKKGTERP